MRQDQISRVMSYPAPTYATPREEYFEVIRGPFIVDDEVSVDGLPPVHIIPFVSYPDEKNTWYSNQPSLTVPDLSETVEQIFARRLQGLPAPTPTSRMRRYPTDPLSIMEEREALADTQAKILNDLEHTKKHAAAAAELAAKNKLKKSLDELGYKGE